MQKYIILACLLCLSIGVVAQPISCPPFVQTALELADSSCMDTGRNEACYGNGLISVDADDDVKFDDIGDIISTTDFSSMRLSELSIDDETWGISLLRVQANLPDTIPGQNVQFVLFGDVEIEDRSTISTRITATAISGVNVRLRPITTENNVIDSLTNGQEVTAVGRLADSSWIQIHLSIDDGTVYGWVSADFLRSDQDFSRLSVLDFSEPSYDKLQAFILKTGIGDAACETAPQSGMLIQTPEGVGEINLLVNEVAIDVGSTILLQSQPNDFLYVTVLEGQAVVTALDTPITVPAGVSIRVPMSEDSTPIRVEETTTDEDVTEAVDEANVEFEVIEYDEENFSTVPIETLEQEIEIASGSAAPIITSVNNFAGGVIVGDGVFRPIYVNFANPDGDELESLRINCTRSNHSRGCDAWDFSSGVSLDESSLVSGDWSAGKVVYRIRCVRQSPTAISTSITLQLIDSDGLTSDTRSLTFDCIAP